MTSQTARIAFHMRIVAARGGEPCPTSMEVGQDGQQRHERKCPIDLGRTETIKPALLVEFPEPGRPVFVATGLEEAQVLKSEKRIADADLTPVREDAVRALKQDVAGVQV